MKPVVSILTITYDRAGVLREAIESVRAQTYQAWELVIFDDGSTDDTEALVQRFQKEDPRIRYRKQSHQGVSGVANIRNLGLREARGRFMAFLDDDDVWFPRKLETEVAYLEQHPEMAFVYTPVHVVGMEGHYQKTRPVSLSASYADLFDGCFVQISSVVARKESLLAAGGFDGSLESSRDYDLWLKVARRQPFGYVEEPLGLYRCHPNSISSNLERRYRMHLEILSRVPVEPSKGITKERKRKRLAVEAYHLARLYRGKGNYGEAGHYFQKSIGYLPTVGRNVCAQKPRGWTLVAQILKPYAAVLYCLVRSLGQSLMPARASEERIPLQGGLLP